ncbi:protein phosphatase 2C domain-containing protein [Gramella jeungdoensis]|uniref:Protein phosphatase 2C domain-containing protein n=1 Tax=Gramella jeungdoensis TaxID=708091 RepID=A0ABT0YZJ1_9FLAO|nr:protein phosphatase 2C domain-containing protein [Gramella jeungdoensis]MCM8568891.1 protein phosphatase 2C domain-containing protein [Gramella jeungdoensis]
MEDQQSMQLRKMNNWFITNKGKRKSNQDVVLIEKLNENIDLFLLADGMGGYKHGEYAAKFVVSNTFKLLKNQNKINRESIQSIINKVTEALALENKKLESKMGATLAGVIRCNEVFHCFWVGDVKIWHLQNDKIKFESTEHNLKNELIDNKVFVESKNAKKYDHVVTRSIHGNIEKAKIDYFKITDFKNDDFIMISSDGANDILDTHYLKTSSFLKSDIDWKLNELDCKFKDQAKDNSSVLLIQ